MSTSLPSDLLMSLTDVKGFNQEDFIRAHQDSHPAISVRLNPHKEITVDKTLLNIEARVPWSSQGYYLKERPSFTLDPLFHAGAYYVQEASSMFVEQAIAQTCPLKENLKVLDLCAAPGGKSTLIQSLISADSLLVSNEVIKSRVSILTENMTKWGASNVIVTNNDPRDFQRLPEYFDLIVADAPCSGSGLFRKDSNAVSEWSKELVLMCRQRQQRILNDVIPALKPGGILIYSTCSFSAEENEDIADFIIKEIELESIQLSLDSKWNIVESKSPLKSAFGYRFYPDKLKGEGFFLSVFKKKTSHPNNTGMKSSHKAAILSKSELEIINKWIAPGTDITFFKWKEDIIAFPSALMNELGVVQSALYIKNAGTTVGTMIREELIPSHALAMSNKANKSIPRVSLQLDQALQYLRRAEMQLNAGSKGWALATFCGMPLGFIKLLSNRINNYYPKEWRILNK